MYLGFQFADVVTTFVYTLWQLDFYINSIGVVCMCNMKEIGFWVVLLLPAAISALNGCPREIESCSYSADRMEASNEVRESIVHVFSNVFGTSVVRYYRKYIDNSVNLDIPWWARYRYRTVLISINTAASI